MSVHAVGAYLSIPVLRAFIPNVDRVYSKRNSTYDRFVSKKGLNGQIPR